MRSLRRILLFAVVVCWWGGSARPAFAWATCWCEIATASSDGTYNASQVSLTSNVGKSYNGCEGSLLGGEQCDENRADCSNRCNNACSGYRGPRASRTAIAPRACRTGRCSVVQPRRHQRLAGESDGRAADQHPCGLEYGLHLPEALDQRQQRGGRHHLRQAVQDPGVRAHTPGPGSAAAERHRTNTWPLQWWTWEYTLWQWAPVGTCVTRQVSPAQRRLN